jgi:putative transposase
VNDRRINADGERRRFTSRILPPYMRRSPKVAEVLPVLYLRGLSTGAFRDALAALLGDDPAGLSATNVARLTNEWETDYRAFQKRSLVDRDYVYVWVDGVHFNVRLEDDRLCTLVMIGVRPDGTKELIAVEDGYRESAESWTTVLRDLKRPGMSAPIVAVGDGALGFWAAVRDVWPKSRAQRDWFHKLSNILDKLPRRLQPRVKAALHEVVYAETREQAREAITRFTTEYGASTRRPSRRWRRTPTRCSRSSTSPPSIGSICGLERDRVAICDGATAPAVTKGAGSYAHGPPAPA